ncbi:MAG: Mur ligase family protein, partial [Clostridiales bacterium]|nr:Mur ligase family protein [Clostridiales bacterium]
MDLTGKRVLVVGTGISGVSAAGLLKEKGIETILFDGNRDADMAAIRRKNPLLGELELVTGELSDDCVSRIDLAILSPGVPIDSPITDVLRQANIPIWGEIELAYHFARGKIVAITGTNGKTTTTALTGEILADYFRDVRVVGNIGIPYTSVASQTTEDTITVAEISSFQLETTHTFRPEVSAILNVTPDHLD